MSVDINVDPEVLEDFARELANFQDTLEDELQSLKSELSRFSETFKGAKNDEFIEKLQSTVETITRAVEAGRDAAEQLNRYQEAVRQALD